MSTDDLEDEFGEDEIPDGEEVEIEMESEMAAHEADMNTDTEPDESTRPTTESVVGLPGEALADILSRAWMNRGWETNVVEDEDGSFLVTGDQGNGQRGLILVLPGDVEVPGKRLQQYASLVKKKDVDVRVVASQGSFTDDAERIANANNVHLLDPQAVLETVEAEGLQDTLATFVADDGSDGGGGGLGAVFSGLPVPAPSIPGGVPDSLPVPSLGGNGLKSILLVVLIASSLLAGFVGGAFLTPGAGGTIASAIGSDGGGGSGDLAIGALSTAEAADAGLLVHWNARTTERVVANGSSFEPPSGTVFLVVQYEVTNTGDDRVPVRPDAFHVNVAGARYTHQPLDGARTFEITALSPGNATTGWAVYSIPASARDAVLVPDPDTAGGPVTYVHDPTMTINGTG